MDQSQSRSRARRTAAASISVRSARISHEQAPLDQPRAGRRHERGGHRRAARRELPPYSRPSRTCRPSLQPRLSTAFIQAGALGLRKHFQCTWRSCPAAFSAAFPAALHICRSAGEPAKQAGMQFHALASKAPQFACMAAAGNPIAFCPSAAVLCPLAYPRPRRSAVTVSNERRPLSADTGEEPPLLLSLRVYTPLSRAPASRFH